MPSISPLITRLTGAAADKGRVDPVTGEAPTRPWTAAYDGGVYVGEDGSVYVYWKFPLAPIAHQEVHDQFGVGQPLSNLLNELGDLSKRPFGNRKELADNRDFHILAITWDARPTPPPDARPRLAQLLDETFTFLTPHKAVFVGVGLRATGKEGASWLQTVADKIRAGSNTMPDLSMFEKDYGIVKSILARNGCTPPTPEEMRRLQGWYSQGHGTDVRINVFDRSLDVWPWGEIELSAMVKAHQVQLDFPDAAWGYDAFTTENNAIVVSVRGELERPEVARARAKGVVKKLLVQMEETAQAGQLELIEDSDRVGLARGIEDYYATTTAPNLTNCSLIIGRRAGRRDENTYADMLRDSYGIEVKPLEMRQMQALHETLPGSPYRLGRTRPYAQDFTPGFIAFAGLAGFASLGEGKGLYVGLALPDMTPVFIDPWAAATSDGSPLVVVTGAPGSGKTFLAQFLCFQAVLNEQTAVFINPKPSGSLQSLATALGGERISMSSMQQEPGALDPFRFYDDPLKAAAASAEHISTCLGAEHELALLIHHGLVEGVKKGARCTWEAIGYGLNEEHPDVVKRIGYLMSNPLARLGIAEKPQASLSQSLANTGRFTLIEFDEALPLPGEGVDPKSYKSHEAIAVAAQRLVFRAAMASLLRAGGGPLVLDEAWHLLATSDGRGLVDALAREARSQGIMPILLTQKVTDFTNDKVDIETFIGRVIALPNRDANQATESLSLLPLEATPERINIITTGHTIKATENDPGRGPLAFMRDQHGKRGLVMVGPVPDQLSLIISTNRDDIARRNAMSSQNGAST